MPDAGIVDTAPLHGIDLTVSGVRLPSEEPAPVVAPPSGSVDGEGILATEPGSVGTISEWREIGDYNVPPLLDRGPGGDAARRQALADEAVELVTSLQKEAAQHHAPGRGFQRKTLYATTTAELRVPANLPRELDAGPFRAGARHRAILRFSNADPSSRPDTASDQRAVGVRITDDAGRVQDLTFTSGSPANHARGASQFNSSMRAAVHLARGTVGGRLRGLLSLLLREGVGETLRMSRARKAAADKETSLAALRYYSRSPIEMGAKLVHLALIPLEGTPAELVHEARGARDGLGRDLCARRCEGDVRFRVAAAEAPGLEDMTVEPHRPWVTVAELVLPRQQTSETEMLEAAGRIHAELAMHPFNVWEEGVLTPRGELNEILRAPVYAASAAHTGRRDDPPATPQYGV
jgi:hypothetical protein